MNVVMNLTSIESWMKNPTGFTREIITTVYRNLEINCNITVNIILVRNHVNIILMQK